MGNKLGRKRQVVDEKHTRPQGLYQHKDVDHKKLRKLILDSKLAPCYPGDDEYTFDLEECPICLLYYPSLNRSRCCTKGICTECFLQMKPPHSTRPTQCPFCKTANYAVEYRGMRSKEEKGMEQIEEQRVIEAKIRMRQQELQDDLGKTQRIQQINSSRRIMTQGEIENIDVSSSSLAVPSFSFPAEGDEITSSHGLGAASTTRQPSQFRQNRDNKFDLDLDDIMLMEAIWLSIKDGGSQKAHGDTISESSITEDQHVSPAMVPLAEASSPSGGLACAIAALAERQQTNGDSSTSNNGNLSTFNLRQESTRLPNREEQEVEEYHPENWSEVSPDSRIAIQNVERGWGTDPGSEMAEAGTSYAHHDTTRVSGLTALPLPDDIEDEFQPSIQGPILPESFEEQMMLAMAISLAEAQARTNTQEAPWL